MFFLLYIRVCPHTCCVGLGSWEQTACRTGMSTTQCYPLVMSPLACACFLWFIHVKIFCLVGPSMLMEESCKLIFVLLWPALVEKADAVTSVSKAIARVQAGSGAPLVTSFVFFWRRFLFVFGGVLLVLDPTCIGGALFRWSLAGYLEICCTH